MSQVDLARTPAAPAPPGMVSNLDNPHTKDMTSSITLAIFGMCIATLFLATRVYTKAVLARLFGLDDVTLILSWALNMAVQVTIVLLMSRQIIGSHVWNISVVELKTLVAITAADAVLYLAVMGLAKVSLLLFYLRISREKWYIFAIYATMALVAGFSIALMLALIFACSPLKRVWDPTITEGHCVDRGKIYLATAGLNAASDIIMLFLPMPMLMKLHVPRVQKIGLVAIFSIGSLTMATSIIRLYLLLAMLHNADMSWAIATSAMWICIEGNLVIVCGCLPIMRLFLRHVCPRLIGEYGSTTGTGRSGGTSKKGMHASSELSNLDRSKRKSYARMMNDSTQGMTTLVADVADVDDDCHDDASELGIMDEEQQRHSEKICPTVVDTMDLGVRGLGGGGGKSASPEHQVAPLPYSQIYSGPDIPPSTPPGHVQLPPQPF